MGVEGGLKKKERNKDRKKSKPREDLSPYVRM